MVQKERIIVWFSELVEWYVVKNENLMLTHMKEIGYSNNTDQALIRPRKGCFF